MDAKWPNKSPEPIAVVAVHAASRRLLGHFCQAVNSRHFSIFIVCAFAAICNTGCVHQFDARYRGPQFTVSLPPLEFEDGEYIESIELNVYDGRIVSINRTWDDWDTDLSWDNPEHMILICNARHFRTGFKDTRQFDRFITIEAGADSMRLHWPPSFDLTATVHTDDWDDEGGEERDYHFSLTEFHLSPRPDPSIWAKRDPIQLYSDGGYCVQGGYSAEEIAAHFHLTMEQLSKLNPDVDLSNLQFGRLLIVSEQARK